MGTIENNIVLDPFCGSGTSLVVSSKLNRNWIGCDNFIDAIEVSKERLSILPFSNYTNLTQNDLEILPIIWDKYNRLNSIVEKVQELEKKVAKFNLPIIITEGKTDVTILNRAWEVLYGNKEKPFEIIAADNTTDNKGGNGGYTALNRLIESVRPDLQLHIALYDRDKGGLNDGFNKLSKNFSDKIYKNNEVKVHQNGKAFATPLPIIPELQKFVDAENLCIEFYFDEKDFKKGLILEKGKIYRKNQRGVILSTEVNEAIEESTIKEGKVRFAETVVPTFDVNSFRHFRTIFELLEEIIEKESVNI